jgi:hypothetical protein
MPLTPSGALLHYAASLVDATLYRGEVLWAGSMAKLH